MKVKNTLNETKMLLNNRYEIVKTLGSGGFGETFLAKDSEMPSNRYCVIKKLKPIHSNAQINQVVEERFQREAAILEKLGEEHKQIPTLYAYFQLNGLFYLVQEYIEGETLTDKVLKEGVQEETFVQGLLVKLLQILDYVHSRKIIHRDIKPDNIILRKKDALPVLIDFGAVRETMGTAVNSQGNPTSSIIIGTPGYMANEQAAGRAVYSSDLYSLGITAVYLLTGKQPQELEVDSRTGDIIWHHLCLNLSPNFKAVIDKAISSHPRERFSTAAQMLAEIQRGVNTVSLYSNNSQFQTQNISYSPIATQNISTPSPNNSQSKTIILSSLIIGSLVSVSVFAGMMLTKSTESTVSKTNPTQPVSVLPEKSSEPVINSQTQGENSQENITSVRDKPSSENPTQPINVLPEKPSEPVINSQTQGENRQEDITSVRDKPLPENTTQPIRVLPEKSSEPIINSQTKKENPQENITSVRDKPLAENPTPNNPTQQPTSVLPKKPSEPIINSPTKKENPQENITSVRDKPSPESVIFDYYKDINSRNYQSAWSRLPQELQKNNKVHPEGLTSFINWWEQVQSVDVSKVTTLKQNNDRVKLDVRVNYNMKTGSTKNIYLNYELSWDSEMQNWKVTRIGSK
jgi:serine/threonine protein kinase, bacterial